MRVGPFGVAAVVVVLLLQVAAAAAAGPWGPVLAVTTGRAALTLACRRSVPAARTDGLGALVAVLAGLTVSVLVVRHAVRRLGGSTGDVLGAACESAVTVSLVVASSA